MSQVREDEIDLDVLVARTATTVARRFRGFVEADALRQEGHLWILTHPGTVENYLTDEENPRRAGYRIRRDLARCMEVHARAEKAAYLGYRPGDEYFYSRGMIEIILPSVLTRTFEPDDTVADMVRFRSGEGPAEDYREWSVMRADVETAFFALGHADRKLLFMVYGPQVLQRDIGAEFGVSQQAVSKRAEKILDKMIRTLGGRRPSVYPDAQVEVSSSDG